MSRQGNNPISPLAELRTAAGMSRNKAAVMLNIGLTTLARYEAGKRALSLELAESMAELYKVTFETLRTAAREARAGKEKKENMIA